MPRTPEQNQKIREAKKQKILNTALSLYVMYGYNGTDMDTVAEKAGVAKGLLYYYFKTKNVLFRELFSVMMSRISSISESFFEKNSGADSIEKLVRYSIDIYGLGLSEPEYIQFSMRMPFDAFAVFGQEGWKEGMRGSRLHMENLKKIIKEGIESGVIPYEDAAAGANSYWIVFVSGLFNFTKMIGKANLGDDYENLENLLAFGMNGLGIENAIWNKALAECLKESFNESI